MTASRTYRMDLQYDGTGLYGWAKQPNGLSTVEGYLEKALGMVLGSSPRLVVAGRTDAGVHARRQVVSLELPDSTDANKLRASLNALTPPGIVVTGLRGAEPGFDARRDAASRTYRYHLINGAAASPFWSAYCWHVPGKIDFRTIREAAEAIVGSHDFTAFTPTETEHTIVRRTVYRSGWTRHAEGRLTFEIEAQSFLRHMVRVLVGSMVELGQGKSDMEAFSRLLGGAARERAGITAPARGLFLWRISY